MIPSVSQFFNTKPADESSETRHQDLLSESRVKLDALERLVHWLHCPSYTIPESARSNSKFHENMGEMIGMLTSDFLDISDSITVNQNEDDALIIKVPGRGELATEKPIALLAHYDIYRNEGIDPERRVKQVLDYKTFYSDQKKLALSSDGATVLGADDKAGIAAIYYAIRKLMEEAADFRPLEIILTPDEEESGASLINLDTEQFDSELMVIVDHFKENTITDKCSGFCSLTIDIDGIEGGHNGIDAGRELLSADQIVDEFRTMLREELTNGKRVLKEFSPDGTDQNFPETSLSLAKLNVPGSGSALATKANIQYTLRSHSLEGEAEVCKQVESIIQRLQEKYDGQANIKLEIESEETDKAWLPGKTGASIDEIMELAKRAGSELGLELKQEPMHGYTQANLMSRKNNKEGKPFKPIVIGPSILNEHQMTESLDLDSLFSTGDWLAKIISLK